MDTIISAALEEVCVRGASGIRLLELWPSLQAAVSSASLELSDIVKKVIWGRLASQPGFRFVVSGSSMERKEVLQGSVEELEKIGMIIVAEEHLRDSFLGLYDLKQSPHFEISQIQRRVLERLAMARSSGITQSELAKELDIKGTNFFYVVKNLECQQLIVRQPTIVRGKECINVKNGPKADQIVNTNLLLLSRFAKNANLHSQQRIEITRPVLPQLLNESCDDDLCCIPIEGSEDCLKEDVHIEDYIPAMKAICDRLEALENKVDIVSGIKSALGYRKTTGHRAWRNILYRLKCSGLVEEFQAEINGKDVACIRLLTKFDTKYFQPKAFFHRRKDLDSENFLKSRKRGQITEQLIEVPLDHQIYDMIDAEGPKGITILELSERLGINSKKLHKRVMSLREKFGVISQSEIHNKQQAYRFWTRNFHSHPTKIFSDNQNSLLDGNGLSQPADSVPRDWALDSNSNGELLVEKPCNGQELPTNSSSCDPASEVIEGEQEPENQAYEENFMDSNVKFDEASSVTESHYTSSTPRQSLSGLSTSVLKTQKYACRSTAVAAQREQWILEKLKNEKFLLKVELHKWLEKIENKPTAMDRKTVSRSLKKLQDAGLCKCIGVHIPSLTNFSSLRYTEAILHPSVNPSQKLVQLIYEKHRSFGVQSRRCSGSARLKFVQPVELPELKNVKSASTAIDELPAFKVMKENGFILAKMVRAKLLHKFLWSYLRCSPYWQKSLNFSKKDCANVLNHGDDQQLFSLDAAIKEMPFELFLQVAGSRLIIADLEKKCKMGLKLSELPVQERRALLDSQATSRLSSIVEILHRLRLIQLVNKGSVQDVNLLSHVLELHPYIEEPAPAVLPFSGIKISGDSYKVRHDFILSDSEAVDRYWESLEYCFASTDSAYSRQCFPASTVEEVFHRRSWSSVRVITTEQRMKLLKRVKRHDQTKKIPFSECLKISRELNLTLEQVLHVYYDKRKTHLTEHCSEVSAQTHNTDITGAVPVKRRRISTHMLSDHSQNVSAGDLIESTERTSSDIDEEVLPLNFCSLSTDENGRFLQACRASEQSPAEIPSQLLKEDAETADFINQCAFNELKPTRKGRFSWTDSSDRKLIMLYARHRAMLGPKLVRVDWPSLCDLPAQPYKCRKRMAFLNKKTNIRKAVLSLCNLLGERYARYLDNSRIKEANQKSVCGNDFEKNDEDVILHDTTQDDSASCVNICKSNSQCYCWDDFEDPDMKMALDEVFKCKKLSKMDDAKRVGCRLEEGRANCPPSNDLNPTSHEPEKCSASSCTGGVLPDNDKKNHEKVVTASATAQRTSNKYSSQGKFLESRGKGSISQIYKSLSIANAIELLKLVFLSCSKAPGVQNLLSRTLRKYPQADIFAAFSYLREKNYLVIGHGSRPFVLSRKFFHHISSSPFPHDSGKRASNFSCWLRKQQSNLMQEGLAIAPDLQCGEIFHLFSLVLSGEISLSPLLPKYGVGEAEESKNLESGSLPEILGDFQGSKNSEHMVDVSCASDKAKKPKLLSDCDRREKGFPGIKIFLNMESVPRADAFECFGFGNIDSHALAGDSTLVEDKICSGSTGNKMNVPHDIVSKSCWDAMPSYFELLSSTSGMRNEARPSATDFMSAHSIICQAGEEGLSIDEIPGALKLKGEKVAGLFVDTLETFQLVAKVNAFDSVRVVDASYASKYFITAPWHVRTQNPGYDPLFSTRPQHMSSGTPGGIFQGHVIADDSLAIPRVGSHGVNEAIARDMSNNPCEYRIEGQSFGESTTMIEKSKNDESFHLQDNVVSSTGNFVAGTKGVPILPWMNGDGSTNLNVYKGLTRRILGIVIQNPCILEEDIITKLDVLNPQSCRRLLETMVLDNHIMVKCAHQTSTSAPPPTILQSLIPSNLRKPSLKLQKHYFANPMSTIML